MVDQLIGFEGMKINLLFLEQPLEVKADTVVVFILYPPSLLECILDILVPLADEHLLMLLHLVFLLPQSHVGDVDKHSFVLGLVPLQECIVVVLTQHLLLGSGLLWGFRFFRVHFFLLFPLFNQLLHSLPGLDLFLSLHFLLHLLLFQFLLLLLCQLRKVLLLPQISLLSLNLPLLCLFLLLFLIHGLIDTDP